MEKRNTQQDFPQMLTSIQLVPMQSYMVRKRRQALNLTPQMAGAKKIWQEQSQQKPGTVSSMGQRGQYDHNSMLNDFKSIQIRNCMTPMRLRGDARKLMNQQEQRGKRNYDNLPLTKLLNEDQMNQIKYHTKPENSPADAYAQMSDALCLAPMEGHLGDETSGSNAFQGSTQPLSSGLTSTLQQKQSGQTSKAITPFIISRHTTKDQRITPNSISRWTAESNQIGFQPPPLQYRIENDVQNEVNFDTERRVLSTQGKTTGRRIKTNNIMDNPMSLADRRNQNRVGTSHSKKMTSHFGIPQIGFNSNFENFENKEYLNLKLIEIKKNRQKNRDKALSGSEDIRVEAALNSAQGNRRIADSLFGNYPLKLKDTMLKDTSSLQTENCMPNTQSQFSQVISQGNYNSIKSSSRVQTPQRAQILSVMSHMQNPRPNQPQKPLKIKKGSISLKSNGDQSRNNLYQPIIQQSQHSDIKEGTKATNFDALQQFTQKFQIQKNQVSRTRNRMNDVDMFLSPNSNNQYLTCSPVHANNLQRIKKDFTMRFRSKMEPKSLNKTWQTIQDDQNQMIKINKLLDASPINRGPKINQTRYKTPSTEQTHPSINEQIKQIINKEKKDKENKKMKIKLQKKLKKAVEQKQKEITYRASDFKVPTDIKTKDAETILKELYPHSDELQIKLSFILHKEITFVNAREKQSQLNDEPYHFEKYHVADYITDIEKMKGQIKAVLLDLSPNEEYGNNLIQDIDDEIEEFNLEQLYRTKQVLELLNKYEKQRKQEYNLMDQIKENLTQNIKKEYKYQYRRISDRGLTKFQMMLEQRIQKSQNILQNKKDKVLDLQKLVQQKTVSFKQSDKQLQMFVDSPLEQSKTLAFKINLKDIILPIKEKVNKETYESSSDSTINLKKNETKKDTKKQTKTVKFENSKQIRKKSQKSTTKRQSSIDSPIFDQISQLQMMKGQQKIEKPLDISLTSDLCSESMSLSSKESEISEDRPDSEGFGSPRNRKTDIDDQIQQLLQIIKTNTGANYFEEKRRFIEKQQRSYAFVKSRSLREKKAMSTHDFIFTAYMLGFKEILEDLFIDKPINFGQATQEINQLLPHGVFTNTIIQSILDRVDVPIEQVVNFLLPGQHYRFPTLADNIIKLESRFGLLNQPNLHTAKQFVHPRIMPLIKNDGTLYIIERLIDDDYSGQINQFLQDLLSEKQQNQKSVTRVLIDGYKISQSNLIDILSNLVDSQTGKTTIKTLTMGNVYMSERLFVYILQKILPSLHSLDLFNLKCIDGFNESEMWQLLEQRIIEQPYKSILFRLRISNMDLRQRMKPIITLIEHSQKTLLDLDLSWCNMNFENLKDLVTTIKQIGLEDAQAYNDGAKKGTLRAINLSYNPFLRGDEHPNQQECACGSTHDHDEEGDSEEESSQGSEDSSKEFQNFTELIMSLVKSSYLKKCTHIDFSGIQAINPYTFLDVLQELSEYQNCNNLLAVHLNDLGFNFDQHINDEIMDIFLINTKQEQSKDHQGGLHTAFRMYIDKQRGVKYIREKVNRVNYIKAIKLAMAQGNPYAFLDKEHDCLQGNHMQLLKEQKLLKNSGFFSNHNGNGTSYHQGNQQDKFVISRKNNIPELIFNQNANQDYNKKRRFFEIDHEMKWQLNDNNCSGKDVCYVCEKQKYCLIFYQRDKSLMINEKGINKELVEIKDPVFLAKMKSEYLLSYSQDQTTLNKMTTPMICGSLVRNSKLTEKESGTNKITNLSFERKLRMMRADLFALMSCSTNSDYIKKVDTSLLVKKAIQKFLDGEMNNRVDKMEIFEMLKGWNKLLYEKCFQNQVQQVHSLNVPDCVRTPSSQMESSGNTHYAFACYVQPGVHQFIIYDPHIEKAFCQEMIVEFNHYQLIYPEMPKTFEILQQLQTLPRVFKKWIRDDIERETKAYYIDTSPFKEGIELRDNFEPERFIKDPTDIEKCEELLLQNFKFFQAFYLHCLSRSQKFPEIDLITFQEQIKIFLFVYNTKTEKEFKMFVKPAEIEVQFISATRHDTKNDRALCRGEFLEILIRLAHIKSRQIDKNKIPRKAIVAGPQNNLANLGSTSGGNLFQTLKLPTNISPKTNQKGTPRGQSPRGPRKAVAASSNSNATNSIMNNLASQFQAMTETQKKSEVHKYLGNMINTGLIPFCEMGPVLSLRRQIQDDPLVERALALRLKELKKVYEQYCVNKQFQFKTSALRLFEMQGLGSDGSITKEHFWYPLQPKDLWSPFILCMMTVLDEINNRKKYESIVLVEFYEWIARVAFRLSDLKKAHLSYEDQKKVDVFRHDQVAEFLDVLLERVGNSKKKKAK